MMYDPKNKILTMSQTDLEHCGFNWDDFESELFLSGMDEIAKDAFTIIVTMHKGRYK